jgi:hypothetical protein
MAEMTIHVRRPAALDPKRVPVVTRAFVVDEARRVRDDVRQGTPADTGGLRRSIVFRTSARGVGAVAVVYSTAPAALQQTVEGGRRAGARMPPPGVLLGWMGRKGIPADKEYAVRAGIKRRGIPGHFMFRRAAERLERRRAAMGRELARRLVRGV